MIGYTIGHREFFDADLANPETVTERHPGTLVWKTAEEADAFRAKGKMAGGLGFDPKDFAVYVLELPGDSWEDSVGPEDEGVSKLIVSAKVSATIPRP